MPFATAVLLTSGSLLSQGATFLYHWGTSTPDSEKLLDLSWVLFTQEDVCNTADELPGPVPGDQCQCPHSTLVLDNAYAAFNKNIEQIQRVIWIYRCRGGNVILEIQQTEQLKESG